MSTILTIRLDGAGKQAIETARSRALIAAGLFVLCFAMISLRLMELGLPDAETDAQRAGPQGVVLGQAREDIVDRNGRLLATNLRAPSAVANPRKLENRVAAAAKLAGVLEGVDEIELRKALAQDTSFVFVKRKLTPREVDAVNRLGLPGVRFEDELERVYPNGALAAHLLGFTNVDNRGLAGVERYFDGRLAQTDRPEGALQLSLDIRVQHALEDELGRAMVQHKAIGATGMVMDVNTGELLAMVSLPTFNPNTPTATPKKNLFNRATLGTYEMGSTFKTFTVAMALEAGTVGISGGYDTSAPIQVADHQIADDHEMPEFMSVAEIFMKSSNIGTARIALDVGGQVQQDFLRRLGLLDQPEIELSELGIPSSPGQWGLAKTMTVSFGHGITVSPLQLVKATAAVVNGGQLREPTLLKVNGMRPGKQVLSPDTSVMMQALMRQVVEDGTGRNADAIGYMVGGKTGTAEKSERGGYNENKLISSFMGMFPADNPQYVVFALLDEPQKESGSWLSPTGGRVAAPVVKRVVERIGPLLGLKPDAPEHHPLRERVLTAIKAEVRS